MALRPNSYSKERAVRRARCYTHLNGWETRELVSNFTKCPPAPAAPSPEFQGFHGARGLPQFSPGESHLGPQPEVPRDSRFLRPPGVRFPPPRRNSACQLLGTPLAPAYMHDAPAPLWPNPFLSDHSQTSVNHALQTSARSAAPSSEHGEQPSVRMSQMRRDDSWSNLQRRLFGDPRDAHASAPLRPPDAPGDPPGATHTPAPGSFDVFSRFGGSFNKLLNSLTWLASLDLSCREFHKGLGRNYSSGNVSAVSSNSYDNPTREGSFYSLSPADSRRAPHSEYHSARSAHAPSAKADTTHPAFNPDYADHRLNIDSDFNMDNNYNYAPHNLSPRPPNRHGRPAPHQAASHGPSASGRAVEAQPAGGGRRAAKSYSGKFFYNDRVVDGVEQPVYDLDVDLGITYSRKRH